MKADVQLPAALWHRSIMPWGQSLQAPSWPSEEHGECLEAAPTQAALHSLDIPLWEWDGDYEAACPLTRSWGGSAQHSTALWQGLCCPLLHSSTLAVPQFPWDYSMDGTMQCHFAMLSQCCCQGRTPLPATPAPAKGGWRKRGSVCTSLGCSEWEEGTLAPS